MPPTWSWELDRSKEKAEKATPSAAKKTDLPTASSPAGGLDKSERVRGEQDTSAGSYLVLLILDL